MDLKRGSEKRGSSSYFGASSVWSCSSRYGVSLEYCYPRSALRPPRNMSYLPHMKSITRLASVLAVAAMFVVPLVSLAQTSIYTDSTGGFQVNSVGTNSSFSFGNMGSRGAFMCGSNNICQVASNILFIINSVLVPVIFALAFVVFLYGIARAYIFSRGEPEEVSKGHQLILWGVIGFVVMVSLWGLVNVVANTFGLTGRVAPMLPTSY